MENKNAFGLLSDFQKLEDVSTSCVLTDEEFEKLSKNANVKTYTLEASSGDFKGEVTFSYWWEREGNMFYCYTSQYRMTGRNHEPGYRANLRFGFFGVQGWSVDSPDAMWQDGQWHSYTRGGWIPVQTFATVVAVFTFDGKWPNPVAINIVPLLS